MRENEARKALCLVGRRLEDKGLIAGGEGNMCIRLDDDSLLITPSGVGKGRMEEADLIRVSQTGEPLDGGTQSPKPSSERRIHLRAMEMRPDCGATIHAHPPTATAFAITGEGLPDDVLPECVASLGPVALCPFGMPGTDELPDSMSPYLLEHKTFLLANHGAFVLGRDIEDACLRMESLEQVAKTLAIARLLGPLNRLPAPQLAELRSRYRNGRLG
jgi:L-fuculose-phosphate aldolase